MPGGTFFFTLVTNNRNPILCNSNSRTILRQAFNTARTYWPFKIQAIVLLPDHLHAIWTLPENDGDFSRRWAFIKKYFTKQWLATNGPEQVVSNSNRKNRRRGVSQRRFWEHVIRYEKDYERHCDYVHYNPVKHGFVSCPHLWRYTSFHRFVSENYYPRDWGCECTKRVPVRRFDDIEKTTGE